MANLGPAWLRGYRREDLPSDVVAGLTVAVLLVPQGLAYAALAGMPPITGLYAALVALVVYAFSGTSSHLSYGPVAIVALLTATAVGPLADGDVARYVALAGTLALMVGVAHLLLGLLRAGTVVDLISHPVIVGFTAAAGIVIALTQARDLLGVEVQRSERALEAAVDVARNLPSTHLPTLTVAVLAVVALLGLKRIVPRIPSAIVVTVVGIAATLALGLEGRGIRVVGAIPAGLPRIVLPDVDLSDVVMLLPFAVVLTLVSFAESISIGKAIAGRSRETLDANRELLASGAANVAVGFTGGFAVAGSFSRSFLLYSARGRTALAGLVAAAAVALTLTLLTPLLTPLPRAVLAAIVLVTVIGLVDVAEARRILVTDRRDGLVLAVTFAATLGLGIEPGLAIGIGSNLLLHVAKGMRPEVVVLGRLPGTREYRNVVRQPGVTVPDGLLLRIDGALDFLSARTVTTRVRALVAARPEVSWIVLNCAGMTAMDSTGLHALHELRSQTRDAGIELRFANLRGQVRETIARAGLAPELLQGVAHTGVDDALAALGLPPDHPLRGPIPDETRPDLCF
jgi:SulP family sulfate permease